MFFRHFLTEFANVFKYTDVHKKIRQWLTTGFV
jgi:hypothetical protein